MSPVSRGRKGKRSKKSARRPAQSYQLSAQVDCDCPSCSSADFDPDQLIDELVAAAAELIETEDPLDAEIVGASLLAIGAGVGEPFEVALIDGFIPEFEARASSEALALLLAIGSVASDRVGKEASMAADRLVRSGLPWPAWAADLGSTLTVADCLRLSDPVGSASVLACTFSRQGRSHAFVISVDHEDCDAAGKVLLLEVEQLPEVLRLVRTSGRDCGVEITTEALDAAEFRWQVERALDARAVHDGALSDAEVDDAQVEQHGPGYPALAVLLRNRMNTLPTPNKAAMPHGDVDPGGVGLAALRTLGRLAGDAGGPFGALTPNAVRDRTALPALSARR